MKEVLKEEEEVMSVKVASIFMEKGFCIHSQATHMLKWIIYLLIYFWGGFFPPILSII